MTFWEATGYLLLGGLATVAFKVVWHYLKVKCWHEWSPWQEGEGEFTSLLARCNWVEQIQISQCLRCQLKRVRRLDS